MNSIVDQSMVKNLVLLDQNLDNFLRSYSTKEGAHCVDPGVGEPHDLLHKLLVHFFVWSDFGNVSIHFSLDTLEFLFCLLPALCH